MLKLPCNHNECLSVLGTCSEAGVEGGGRYHNGEWGNRWSFLPIFWDFRKNPFLYILKWCMGLKPPVLPRMAPRITHKKGFACLKSNHYKELKAFFHSDVARHWNRVLASFQSLTGQSHGQPAITSKLLLLWAARSEVSRHLFQHKLFCVSIIIVCWLFFSRLS